MQSKLRAHVRTQTGTNDWSFSGQPGMALDPGRRLEMPTGRISCPEMRSRGPIALECDPWPLYAGWQADLAFDECRANFQAWRDESQQRRRIDHRHHRAQARRSG